LPNIDDKPLLGFVLLLIYNQAVVIVLENIGTPPAKRKSMTHQRILKPPQLKILLILADGRIHKIRLASWVRSMREAPLTLTTLAALTPEIEGLSMRLVDESVEPVPMDFEADIVGISAITGNAPRAYELAQHFRNRGATVVLGGVHPTLFPDEAAQYADSVVVGMAEKSWPQLFEDYRSGCLRPRYQDDCATGGEFYSMPSPRRDLQQNLRYMMPMSTQATRGCMRKCSFCTVGSVWPSYQKRPIGEVIADIKTMRGRRFAFNDVSLVDDEAYARELFKELTPLNKRWGGLATADIGHKPELVEAMAKSGCRYLLIGFESIHQLTLQGIHKGFNKAEQYKELMDLLHSNGISVQGCFVFGFDTDTTEVFKETVDWVQELQIDIPRYAIATPYPGTPYFKEMEEAGRILTRDWSKYDTTNVVFQPIQMTAEELYAGYCWAYQKTFELRKIRARMQGLSIRSSINFVGNLAYRRYANELNKKLSQQSHGLQMKEAQPCPM